MNLGANVGVVDNDDVKINFFPNPAKYYINLEIDNNLNSFYEIIDMRGETLLSGTFLNTVQIDFKNLSNGSYFIKVKNSSKSYTKKLSILR